MTTIEQDPRELRAGDFILLGDAPKDLPAVGRVRRLVRVRAGAHLFPGSHIVVPAVEVMHGRVDHPGGLQVTWLPRGKPVRVLVPN